MLCLKNFFMDGLLGKTNKKMLKSNLKNTKNEPKIKKVLDEDEKVC